MPTQADEVQLCLCMSRRPQSASTPDHSPRRVIITYEAVPDLSTWQRLQPDLVVRPAALHPLKHAHEHAQSQLPLRNLHWKTASRSLRTIQALDVDFRAFKTLPEDQAHQIPLSLLERPYLHLIFVACDVRAVFSR